jgi:hypothetical protein
MASKTSIIIDCGSSSRLMEAARTEVARTMLNSEDPQYGSERGMATLAYMTCLAARSVVDEATAFCQRRRCLSYPIVPAGSQVN